MIAFLSNSAWYLKNFRLSTLQSFIASRKKIVNIYPVVGESGYSLSLPGRHEHFYMDPTSTNFFKEFISFSSLFLAVCKNRPSIVFSFNPKTNLYSLIACWLLRLPCVPNVSGVGVASQLDGMKGRLYRVLASFFYRRAKHVFFQNWQDREAFLDAGWVSEERSEVIPGSGVDLTQFRPKQKQSGRPVRFLMAARLLKAKGVLEYLQATHDLQADMPGKVEFLLAGALEPTERGVPEAEIEVWGQVPGMRFLGHVDDMAALLDTVDCVVLPSYYPEGVPRSLIEAAAAGKVIVTTAMPGCQEVVLSGENGWCVPPRDVEALYQAMLSVTELDETELVGMGRASRTLAEERFDENIVIKKYLDVAEHFSIIDSVEFDR